MGLSLPDRWIWDFWLAKDGPDFHIYYLQAPRGLADPGERHWHTAIGHAVSGDLLNWEILPDALEPSEQEGAWDDYTTWTGSVIEHSGLWYLFYTGGNRREKGLIQRIGLAISKDLINWQKYDANPVLVSDPRRYEALAPDLWHDQAWRDPWVMKKPDGAAFYAYITSRVNYGPPDGRGVIALAQSDDLLSWEVMDPVTSPGEFGHMEVPQVVQIEGTYYLLFSAVAEVYSAERIQRISATPVTGTHYLVSVDPQGPYRSPTTEFLIGDVSGGHYGGKLIEVSKDQWVLLTMRHFDEKGSFIGELGDPIPVWFGLNGMIQLGEQ